MLETDPSMIGLIIAWEVRFPFAVTDIKQAAFVQRLPNALVDGTIQRVISHLASHNVSSESQPQQIKHIQHHFKLTLIAPFPVPSALVLRGESACIVTLKF